MILPVIKSCYIKRLHYIINNHMCRKRQKLSNAKVAAKKKASSVQIYNYKITDLLTT